MNNYNTKNNTTDNTKLIIIEDFCIAMQIAPSRWQNFLKFIGVFFSHER